MKRKLVLDGIVVGIIAGMFSVLYRLLLEWAVDIRNILFGDASLMGIIKTVAIFVLMALVVHFMLKFEPLSSGSGIPQVQAENMGYLDMNPVKVLLGKLIGGVAGNVGGLSLGREGPSIQIGAAAGKICAIFMKRTDDDRVRMISAGASAGLSAAFNAPVAGTLFTLEEMHKNFTTTLIVPSFIASIIADFISENIFGIRPIFSFDVRKVLPLEGYWHLLIFGIFVGFAGVLFNKLLLLSLKMYDIIRVPLFIKRLLPFVAMLITGYFVLDLLGGGHHLISEIDKKPIALWIMIVLFLAKLLLTCFCYGSGAQGGIFLPVLVLGGLCGAIYYTAMSNFGIFVSDYYSNFIIVGMVGYLTAVVRSPILSILLVTEMTGNFSNLLSTSMVAVIAYVIANSTNTQPIYESLLDRILKNIKTSELEDTK